MACLVECALCGSTEPEAIQREKVRRSLERNAKLQARIQSCSTTETGQLIWMPELERVQNVVVKLAQGHAAYELYPVFEPPNAVDIRPFVSMTDSERESFDSPQHEGLQAWPEIGFRAFMRACMRSERSMNWKSGSLFSRADTGMPWRSKAASWSVSF
ncbi:MAG: hypothetical protein WD534_12790 [Phycisphaeraceae bacterium]